MTYMEFKKAKVINEKIHEIEQELLSMEKYTKCLQKDMRKVVQLRENIGYHLGTQHDAILNLDKQEFLRYLARLKKKREKAIQKLTSQFEEI